MKPLFLILLSFSAFAETTYEDFKKASVKTSLQKLQAKIRPGRLSKEQEARLQQMTNEGRFIVPSPQRKVTAKEIQAVNYVLMRSHEDIKKSMADFPKSKSGGYKEFLSSIAGTAKIPSGTAPKTSPEAESSGDSEVPLPVSVPVDAPPTEAEKLLAKLQRQLNSKDAENESALEIFSAHSRVYKTEVIPALMENLRNN